MPVSICVDDEVFELNLSGELTLVEGAISANGEQNLGYNTPYNLVPPLSASDASGYHLIPNTYHSLTITNPWSVQATLFTHHSYSIGWTTAGTQTVDITCNREDSPNYGFFNVHVDALSAGTYRRQWEFSGPKTVAAGGVYTMETSMAIKVGTSTMTVNQTSTTMRWLLVRS